MSVARRRRVFEGRQLLSGVLLPDTPSSRAHVLSTWRPGTVVQPCALGLVVRFPSPRELDCDELRGEGLIAQRDLLVGLPLDREALDALRAPGGSVVVARADRPVTVAPGREVDPSEWLTLEPAVVVEVPRPTLPAAPMPKPLAPRPLDLRPDPASLPPEASRALVEALDDRQPSRQPLPRRAAASILRWWRARRSPQRALPAASGDPQPGPLARVEAWANRQLDRTPMGRWLDELNRTYVDRLLRMFEREALDDALKHAVPLSRKQAEPGAHTSRLPLAPRATLAVNFGARGRDGGPSAVMPHGVYEALKQRYRTAAEKLEQAGRIDEAAFVLADLLDAPQEAVALFERHQQFDKAARLAEARTLAPDLVVRLWVLAKDLERATVLARRHRVFAGAVTRLEQGNLAEARVLRLQWGEWLASSGDFGGAVQAVRPLAEARPLMLQWIDLGIEAGGPQRAALLVRRLELEPRTSQPHVELALGMLQDTAEATAGDRALLAEELAGSRNMASVSLRRTLVPGESADTNDVASVELRQPLVRAAIRAMVRDEAAFGVTKPGVIGRLLAFDEGPLRADVPSYAPGVRAVESTTTRFERVATALTPVDAVLLANGAVLVALGESGVALVGHDGKVKWRADVPAHALVASDEGASVLALAPREDVTTVSRISLAPRRAARWADVQLSGWSDTSRDGTWFIAAGARVLGLDVLGDRPVPLWELPPLANAAPVSALAASVARVSILTAGMEIARRTWRLPAFEDELVGDLHRADVIDAMATDAEGQFALFGRGAGQELRVWTPGAAANQPLVSQALPGKLAGTPSCRAGSFAVPVQWRRELPDQIDVLLRPGERTFGFGHATKAHTRFQGGHLIICCDNGRVVVFDLSSRRVVRDLSVPP